MTTTTLPIVALRAPTIAAVEARKMTDTRGGRGLIALIVALAALVVIWRSASGLHTPAFADYFSGPSWVVLILAPIVGLLSMTSEWTQRTALSTFALAPRRSTVLAAKIVVAVSVSQVLLAVVAAMSFAAAAADDASFDRASADVAARAAIVALHTLTATGLGAVTAYTAPALVAFLAAPTALNIVANQGNGEAWRWIDIFAAYDRLTSEQPSQHLVATLTAIALWVVLPTVLGFVRSVRREAK